MARRRRRRRRSLGAVSIARTCPREGTRVEFNPLAVSHALYRDYPNLPKRGERGTVYSISFGRGRRTTCLKGPGGGLVYVKWDRAGHAGVSSIDIDRVKR